MKKFLSFSLLLITSLSYSKPLTFVTYHATSQYYPTMSANAIFNAVPYGGKLILKVEPEVNKIKAKKSLKANNLVAEGDVQFGGTTATKGTLSMHNVKGSAKGLEAVDAHINNLYLYGIKFPTTDKTMSWQELTLANGYTATFLTAGFTAPQITCEEIRKDSGLYASNLQGVQDTADDNFYATADLAYLAQKGVGIYTDIRPGEGTYGTLSVSDWDIGFEMGEQSSYNAANENRCYEYAMNHVSNNCSEELIAVNSNKYFTDDYYDNVRRQLEDTINSEPAADYCTYGGQSPCRVYVMYYKWGGYNPVCQSDSYYVNAHCVNVPYLDEYQIICN